MSWFLLVVTGVGLLTAQKFFPPRVDFALVRLAGGAFMGAGLIGANGWLGEAIDWAVQSMISLTDRVGVQALGEAVAWVLAAGVGLLWVGAMLPDRICRYDPPTWLIWSGLVAPALLTTVPGDLGEVLRQVTTWAGTATQDVIGGLVS
ncbi:MAG: hypothetical protein ACRCYX_12515 [Dermatophilaceae bacterium]